MRRLTRREVGILLVELAWAGFFFRSSGHSWAFVLVLVSLAGVMSWVAIAHPRSKFAFSSHPKENIGFLATVGMIGFFVLLSVAIVVGVFGLAFVAIRTLIQLT